MDVNYTFWFKTFWYNQNPLALAPSKSGKDKGALAKSLAKRFACHPDELLELLPNGKSKTLEAPQGVYHGQQSHSTQ
jgi:hypothetical protein